MRHRCIDMGDAERESITDTAQRMVLPAAMQRYLS